VRMIGEHVGRMLRQSLDAFTRFDMELAYMVIKEDKLVDAEYKTAMRSLVTAMMEDSRNIASILSIMWVLRALERVGDHARNICQHVIYMVHGKDVRHTSLEKTGEIISGK
jgi:phosphate transport system protein